MSAINLTIEANTDNLDKVLSFVDQRLEELGCSMKVQMQIDLAIEEVYVNVAQYAYQHLPPEERRKGMVSICVEDLDDPKRVEVTFADEGIPFDPLAKEDPDVTLNADSRPIGGLGIFMVKKSMDSVEYEYKDGKNILKFRKDL